MRYQKKRIMVTFQFTPELAKSVHAACKQRGVRMMHASNLLQMNLMLMEVPVESVIAKVESMEEYEKIRAAVRRLSQASVIAVSENLKMGLSMSALEASPGAAADFFAERNLPKVV
jgi:hypothetical protein